MKNVLLIGLGRFGRHIAMKLNELNHQVMAVDKDEKNVNAVVFIPPAVDPGEPPISIKMIMINCPVPLNKVKSAVLKPAVRGVTA